MKVIGKFICCLALAALAQNSHAQLPSIPVGRVIVEVQQVATGLSSPVEIVPVNDGSGRLFILEQPGRIRVLKNGAVNATPFLDVTGRTLSGGEQGLLGLAFSPGFNNPASPGFRKLYTYSTEPPTGTPDFSVAMSGSPANHCVLAEWQVSGANPDVVDPSTRREVLRIAHPQANHNGGEIGFRASDGFLYIAIGDGGASNDVGDGHTQNIGNAQDVQNLLGKILRIDPLDPALNAGSPHPLSANRKYRNANTNPFVGAPGREEIFAYGFRNPYRFSFDVPSDSLFVGDVGQGAIEEVDIVELGRNYGWNRKEGSFLFNPANGGVSPDPNPSPAFTNPIFEYDHGDGISVIGGFVYRGSAVPALAGKYVFADFLQRSTGTGRLFYGDVATRSIQEIRIGTNGRALGLTVKGFGSDTAGELYLAADNSSGTAGQILKIVPVPATPALVNLSGRARVEVDDNVAIAGLIITGSGPKTVVLRAIGPSLSAGNQPVPGRLTNPTLALHNRDGTLRETNNDWGTHPRRQELPRFNLEPGDPRDAAMVVTLEPGDYTAIMRGVNGETGVGLVEVFDVSQNAGGNAVNLSTRASVQTSDNVLIAGLVIGGSLNQRVLVRAIGPSLAREGVSGALQNPTLQLVNSSGATVATNDNWRSDQQAEITTTGLAPREDAESAIVRTLPPGAYTAIVRGAGNTTGVGLVEVYRLGPQQ
ncbi:MAG TPA: PQQ-dependent sugar dehydrogenase [Chthoniobacterales bacterium]